MLQNFKSITRDIMADDDYERLIRMRRFLLHSFQIDHARKRGNQVLPSISECLLEQWNFGT